MPTFRSKEIVDARQFNGGEESAIAISEWLKALDPEYYSHSEFRKQVAHSRLGSLEDENVVLDDRLVIYVSDGRHQLFAGSWLVRRQSGRWMVYYDEKFQAEFDQV